MIRGSLFTQYFLEDGVRGTAAWRDQPEEAVLAFAQAVRGHWAALEAMRRPSEAETVGEFIHPVMELLGWHRLSEQEPGSGRRDIADDLLFLSADAKARAMREHRTAERFRHGVVVVENEARDTVLDRGSASGEAPSSQIIRYLIRADTVSDGAVRWGLLTNGRAWRLYWSRANSRAEGFVELDLPALVSDLPPPVPAGADASHWLRVFLLLFSRDALLPDAQGRTFLDDALAEGKRYEERITARLSETVFNRVFPDLVRAIGAAVPAPRPDDAAWRAELRDAALLLLYRLLFLFYAEDRDLLPMRHEGYAGYSLRGLREKAAQVVDQDRPLSVRAFIWWPGLLALFTAIAKGDSALGVPPYNGGLFDDAASPLLATIVLPDALLAPLLDAMSREPAGEGKRWINYRDLSVQQLGGIYERLLERDVVLAEDGTLALRPNAFARRTTGSYYTPDELVQLILRRAVGPLLAERRAAFVARARELAGDNRRKAERLDLLAPFDPAEAFLQLRICDPAMGSGHFLVSLVDYLADETLGAVAEAPVSVPWGDYRSPLMARIDAIRARIKAQAAANGWPVRDDQLDDRHIVRRIVLKRCVYGVDLNPMAVELAKLALWLHSFTVGAPLSFLDHHLRCGDSLFGEFWGPVGRDLHTRYGLSMSSAVVAARQAAKGMALVEEQTDADIAEVAASAAGFAGVEQDTAPLRAFLDLYHAARWLPDKDPAAEAGRGILFGGGYGDPVAIAGGAALKAPRKDAADIVRSNGRKTAIKAAEAHRCARDFVAAARKLSAQRRFLHWEVAFPGVWEAWEALTPPGGFHAVVGNPPWDRMKMQEVEWFAARVPAIAGATRAADRKRAIEALRQAADPVAAEYDLAAGIAETAARVVRDIGARSPLPDSKDRQAPAVAAEDAAYPLLSGGDVNLYSLMVERAARLVRRDGIVGLLVPSGISADLGAAPFFRGISTTGRLAALLDFENRRTTLNLEPFFPDVDSRFKFSALVFGGRERRFAAADCAFFKQSAKAAEEEAFTLAPADFAAVNPNTGTAPVFRAPRDAGITRSIYARLPVLVDRREKPPRHVWPLRYLRMFDMTNDSAKFRSEAELRALGAYEVQGRRWEKGSAQWVPLYEGKMVQAFDHRAASVVVNDANVHRPGQPESSTDAEHKDPAWFPRPQYWVSTLDVSLPADIPAVIGFKDITSPTNARTLIAALLPPVGASNKLPLLLPDTLASAAVPGLETRCGELPYARWAPLFVANLNSLVLDFVARQKVHGTTLNLFIVEQLPVVPATEFARPFGTRTAEQIVRDDVLALTYTAHDMAAFARAMGHSSPPFAWNPEDRLRRRARLDALFFHLYGLDRDAAAYVLDTFPIVRREEEARYGGRFRSKDLILGFMAALAAGRPDAPVAG